MSEHDRELAFAFERTLTRQALEQHAAKGVDVGATVDRAAFDLLWWNVVDRPDETAVASQAAGGRHMPRQAEVADVYMLTFWPCGHEDVAGLHIPVNQSSGVCHIDGLGDLADKFQSALRLERAFVAQQLTESVPSTCAIAR